MTRQLPPALLRIVQYQHGVVTRGQALRAGITADGVRSRVDCGTWRQIYRGVYHVTPGPVTREARLWAAVLYCGRGAVLSHETAAELHGLTAGPSAVVHVSIPSERRIAGAPGLRIHRVQDLAEPPDAHRDPPHTPICDTLLDLADAADDLDTVCGWITSAFSNDKLAELQLLYAMSRRGRLRWRKQLSEIVTCAATGDHSALEHRYTRDVEKAHGLPESVRQVPFTKDDGREGRRDREYTEYGLVIELDGDLSHSRNRVWADKRRDREAGAQGKQSARYGWIDVSTNPCATAAQVAQILRRRGWAGTVSRCFPGCQAPSFA